MQHIDFVSVLKARVTFLPQPLLSLNPLHQLLSTQIKGGGMSARRHFTLEYEIYSPLGVQSSPESLPWFLRSQTNTVRVHNHCREHHISLPTCSSRGPQEPSVTQLLLPALARGGKRDSTKARRSLQAPFMSVSLIAVASSAGIPASTRYASFAHSSSFFSVF